MTAPAQPQSVIASQYHAHAEQARAGMRIALGDEAQLLRRTGLNAQPDARSLRDLLQTTSLDPNGLLQREAGGYITVRSDSCDNARPEWLSAAQRYFSS